MYFYVEINVYKFNFKNHLMKGFVIAFFTLCFLNTFAQSNQCNCESVFNFVSTTVEENSASYQHQVVELGGLERYNKFKKELTILSKNYNTQKECSGLLALYLSFINDSHQWVSLTNPYYPFKTFNDTIAVKKFLNENVENYPLVDAEVLNKNMEGNWISTGGLKIQIQKNNTKGRSYVGLMRDAVSYYAKEGDVRIDFYETAEGLKAILWDYGLKPTIYPVELKDGILKFGRAFIFVNNEEDVAKKEPFELDKKTYFKKLNDETNYLRIHSFDYYNKKNIDSILLQKHQQLTTTKNLIIDIRNNPGGTDLAYQNILKYIFDKTSYKNPLASSVWGSKDNFKSYEETVYFGAENKQDSLEYEKEFQELAKYKGTFEPLNFDIEKIDEIFPFPKKVFIITNRNNASTAEGFVINALKSGKVTTIGENTGGVMSYAEWRRVDIPDFPAWISVTRKKVQTENNVVYEKKGLPPNINIEEIPESEWIDYILELIKKT